MDKEQEEFLKLIIAMIIWFNNPEKIEFIDEDIIKKCKENRLLTDNNIIFGDDNNAEK